MAALNPFDYVLARHLAAKFFLVRCQTYLPIPGIDYCEKVLLKLPCYAEKNSNDEKCL